MIKAPIYIYISTQCGGSRRLSSAADDLGVTLLGGSWVVISGVISRVTIIITDIRGLKTPPITTLNPKPSRK